MTVDLHGPVRLVLPGANRVGHGPSLRSGFGTHAGRVIDAPRMLLLLREHGDDIIEMLPGPDHPRQHGRPADRLSAAPAGPGGST